MSGLEVVGSIASVVQLAGTVYAISKTLYEVGETDHMMDALGVPNVFETCTVPFSETQLSPYQKWRKDVVDSALSHFQMTQEQAEAWADSLPVPTLSVANPASTPASQTYNPQLLSTTPLSQYAPSYELESPDLGSSDPYIYLSGQPIAGKALMHPQPPTSWPPFGKRETKVAYCNHVGLAGQEDDTSPNKQGTADLTDERLSEIDKVRIPLSLKRHRMLPQPVPSWVATWKELKQWVSDDSNLPPEALRAVIKAQKLHYSQLTRKVRFASQARQGVPQISPPGIAFPIVPTGQSSMRISNSNISTGSSLEEHSSAQENDKLHGIIPSGNLAEASDEMTRQALDQFVKDNLENYTTIIRYFADIAILIARYSVLESIYQQWSGMSLDPDYKKAIVDLCVLVLAYIARFLNSKEAASSRAQALDSQMGKIAEADAKYRGFTVTFPIYRKVEDSSEDDSDSDNTATDIKAMKRSFSDVSDDITKPASIKTLVHENNDTSLPVAEVVASKRIRN
ncbi:hypothetical protein DL95DRAFT_410401 [Leptodontidium sp. 2 PMI_412]|nr:hypothetical protein DL95DRAFT_410401 [Leptodontidium sp. 2 PMI_412]